MENGNVSKRQQSDHRSDNSQRQHCIDSYIKAIEVIKRKMIKLYNSRQEKKTGGISVHSVSQKTLSLLLFALSLQEL